MLPHENDSTWVIESDHPIFILLYCCGMYFWGFAEFVLVQGLILLTLV